MSITITLPTGEKLRSYSQCRYVVIDKFVDGKPFIVRRTDNITRAIAEARKRRFGFVYDQVERRFVVE